MGYTVDDLENSGRFVLLQKISYNELLQFVLRYLKKRSVVSIIYWSTCAMFAMIAVYIRISISGAFPLLQIMLHTFIGLIAIPLLSIPVHEVLHIIPYYIAGARDIRAGMDLSQYMFFVTAHRYVTNPSVFKVVAAFPWQILSITTLILILLTPPLWKWSLSLFLFIHATMCAGDIALLNFYFLNRKKKIYTWDDADKKETYFYQEL